MPKGLSDEEELIRSGAVSNGVGEIFVQYDEENEQDFQDLDLHGLIS